MTNEEVIEKTKEEMKLRGLTKGTEKEYQKTIRIFMEYYENQPTSEISEVEMRKFLLYLMEEKAANGGVAA